MKYILSILFFSLSVLAASLPLRADQAVTRWYEEEQVAQGQQVFRQHCAVCHGQNAEQTVNWKQTDANGNYPPPPLNGTAHAWHHDLELLRRTIREGGQKLGGLMPPFEQVLTASEIDSAIAFFQSKWQDELYAKWAERFEVSKLPSLNDVDTALKNKLTQWLRQRIGKVDPNQVEMTSVEDVWRVKIKDSYIYLIEGGRYAFTGDFIDLEKGRNLTPKPKPKPKP